MCTHSPESQLCAGLHPKQHDRIEGGDSAPLLWPCETLSEALHPALGSSAQERQGSLGAGLEEGHEDDERGVKHVYLEERLKNSGLFSLEQKKAWDDLIAAFQYIKGTDKKEL